MGKGDRNDRIRLRSRTMANERALQSDAVAIVARWNAELAADQSPQFSPTIQAALRAERPFLRLLCPGCRQYGHVDLRKIVRPANYPIMGIYDALRGHGGCRSDGPAPKVIGLFRFRDGDIDEMNEAAN
jgi:hypothetical protein